MFRVAPVAPAEYGLAAATGGGGKSQLLGPPMGLAEYGWAAPLWITLCGQISRGKTTFGSEAKLISKYA